MNIYLKKKIRVKMHGMEASRFWDRQIQRFSKIVKNNTEMEYVMKLVGIV